MVVLAEPVEGEEGVVVVVVVVVVVDEHPLLHLPYQDQMDQLNSLLDYSQEECPH